MLFAIKNLSKQRPTGAGGGFVLNIPSFAIMQGDKILLTGPSGSGKSTLLDMLGLVLSPDKAEQFEINLKGSEIDIMALWHGRQLEQLAKLRRHMGYVLQTGGLLPYLNARRNIELAFKPQGQPGLLDKTASELGIDHLLNKLPAKLSVGERQRVAIARAVVRQPQLILADEPTAALDPAHGRKVLDIFTRMVDELKLTLFLVTHDTDKVPPGFRHFIIEHDISHNITHAVLREVGNG